MFQVFSLTPVQRKTHSPLNIVASKITFLLKIQNFQVKFSFKISAKFIFKHQSSVITDNPYIFFFHFFLSSVIFNTIVNKIVIFKWIFLSKIKMCRSRLKFSRKLTVEHKFSGRICFGIYNNFWKKGKLFGIRTLFCHFEDIKFAFDVLFENVRRHFLLPSDKDVCCNTMIY